MEDEDIYNHLEDLIEYVPFHSTPLLSSLFLSSPVKVGEFKLSRNSCKGFHKNFISVCWFCLEFLVHSK